jgi:hypothetical protein
MQYNIVRVNINIFKEVHKLFFAGPYWELRDYYNDQNYPTIVYQVQPL